MSNVDTQFIQPFVESTISTLKIQCQVELKPGKPFIKGKGPDGAIDIAAIIGLTSKSFNGSVAICFPEKSFLAIMGKMLSDQFATITKDLEDGAGELLNIIFGGAKTVLNSKGYAIDKAIPTIVRGSQLKVQHITPSPTVVIPFESEAGPFYMEIGTEGEALKS